MSITRDDALNWIKAIVTVIGENSTYLTQLDAAIGDADHGANMERGFKAVMNKLPEISDKDIGTIFKTVGMTLISTVGGAGGPLYGTFFLQAGMKTAGKMELNLVDWTDALEAALNGVIMRGKAELGDKTVGMTLISTVGGAGGPLYGTFFLQAGMKTAGKMELNLVDWTEALEAALNGVIMRGKAELGDKTMVDALTPAVAALKESASQPINKALELSAEAARKGMEGTIPLVARKGRASYLGERSADHQDPGATSSFLILKAAADSWKDIAS